MLVLIKDEKDIEHLITELKFKLTECCARMCNARTAREALSARLDFIDIYNEYYEFLEYRDKNS